MTRIDPAAWAAFSAQPTEEHFAPLYEQSRGLVWTLCWRILRDQEDALDAFQGVYARLLAHAREAGAQGMCSLGGPEQLIYQLTIREANRLRASRRRRGRREVAMDGMPPTPAEDPSAREAAEQAQARTRMEALVAGLPEKYRFPLELHFFHGLSQTEIAGMMGKDKGTVSRRIAHGLRLLEPLAARAGLGRASALLAAALGGAGLAQPPAAQATALVFAKAQALAAAGLTTAGGATAIKLTLGAMIMKSKFALAALAAAAMLAVVVGVRSKDNRSYRTHRTDRTYEKSEAATTEPLAFASVATVPQAAPRTNNASGAVVTGHVRAKVNGRPATGVPIRAAQAGDSGKMIQETLSDAAGFYRLEGLPRETELKISAEPKTADLAWDARLLKTKGQEVFPLDFILDAAGEVAIRASDPDGRPLAGTRVHVEDPLSPFPFELGRTDAAGGFVARNLNPKHPTSVELDRKGYERPASQYVKYPPGKRKATLDFILKPEVKQAGGVFTGTVTDAQGAPLPGIAIEWGYQGDKWSMSRAQSGPDGRYQLVIRKEADKTLTVSGKGWATQARRELTPGTAEKPAIVNFTMQPGHWLSGTVVDDKDRPLPGINVIPEGTAPEWFTMSKAQTDTQTDARGRFRIEDLPEDGFNLKVWHADYSPEYIERMTADREVRIALKPWGVLRGRVIDQATREPVKSFSVHLTDSIPSGNPESPRGKAFNSAEGTFELAKAAPQGKPAEITIEAAGYPVQTARVMPCAPDQKSSGTTVELRRGGTLRGLVLDRASGKPLEGAEVIYCALDERFPFQWDAVDRPNGTVRISQRTNSDRHGAFTLGVGEERGAVLIIAEGHQKILIRSGERAKHLIGDTLVVRLGAEATLSGKVTLNGSPTGGAYLNLIRQTGMIMTAAMPSESQRARDDATYRFTGLEPGDYLVTVQRDTKSPVHHQLQRRLKLAEGEQKVLNVGEGMGDAALSGRVLDHGRPLPAIVIELTPLFDWDFSMIGGASGADGAFAIQGLRPGRYQARLRREPGAWKPGQPEINLKETIEVKEQQTRHDFELKRGHNLTGRLVFDPATPADFRAALKSAAVSSTNFMQRAFRGIAGADGIDDNMMGRVEGDRILIEGTFKGDYEIALGTASQSAQKLKLPGIFKLDTTAADQDLGEIRVAAVGQARIRLNVNGPAAEPPEHVMAFLKTPGEASASTSLNLDSNQAEQTLGPIPAGTYELTPFAPGWRVEPPAAKVAIKAGETAGPLAFTLTPEGFIMGASVSKAAGAEMPVKADRITLAGPGVARTIVPGGLDELKAMSQFNRQEDSIAIGPMFQFHNLPAGQYSLTIEAAGYETVNVKLDVATGKVTQAPVQLTPKAAGR